MRAYSIHEPPGDIPASQARILPLPLRLNGERSGPHIPAIVTARSLHQHDTAVQRFIAVPGEASGQRSRARRTGLAP